MRRDTWVGWLALAAGPVTLAGLVLGISLTDFDAEAFRDPEQVLALGADKATTLRVSYLLTALGSYLMVVPLALWLRRRLARDTVGWDATTVLGLAYLGLGATGAGALAAAIPELIRLSAESGADQDALVIAWHTANRIGEDGLQGMVQNLAGAAWWLGLGAALRGVRPKLAVLTLVLGVASAVNAAGSLAETDALQVPGLTVTVLLSPVWAFVTGLWVLRSEQEPASAG